MIFLAGSLGHEGTGQDINRRDSGKELQGCKNNFFQTFNHIFFSIYKIKLVSFLYTKRLLKVCTPTIYLSGAEKISNSPNRTSSCFLSGIRKISGRRQEDCTAPGGHGVVLSNG